MNHRILIMGGTGVFGYRLADHLGYGHTQTSDLDVIITSRHLEKAKRSANLLRDKHPGYSISGAALDHRKGLQTLLDNLKPFVVVDCSGPFQKATYDVAKTVLGAGIHLIDLADARDYLKYFAKELGPIATQHGAFGFTGASSTPTLSSCVVRHLAANWKRIDTIDICITPGGKSEVGRSVIEAIMSYAGEKISIWEHGKPAIAIGWRTSRQVDIPGLGRRRVSPVETFDAELLGDMHNVQSRVSFAAGLESLLEQWGINAIAWMRQLKIIPHPSLFIPALLHMRKITRRYTSDKGAMVVDITGINTEGDYERARWSLLAENDHGPFVPVLPAAALIKGLLNGAVPAGAHFGFEGLSLEQITNEMTPYAIQTNVERETLADSIFQTHLEQRTFASMPKAVQSFHIAKGPVVWRGTADVQTGRGFIKSIIAKMFGFPKAGRNVDVVVAVDRFWNGKPKAERWVRTFRNVSFSSTLTVDAKRRFLERFGPFAFAIGLNANPDGLKMPVAGWRLNALPLPRFLAPKSEAKEYQDEHGRFVFDVKLTLPLLGPLAHYKGWLQPASGTNAEDTSFNPEPNSNPIRQHSFTRSDDDCVSVRTN